MKEFIEKLIGRLEEKPVPSIGVGKDYIINGNAIPKKRVVEIVNELAEEYSKDKDWETTRRFLDEKYFSKIRELSEKYNHPCEDIPIDFVWVFGLIEKIEGQLAEEYNNGWIPCETGCKMPNEATRVWLSFTTPFASFVKSAWYINGHFEWDNCRRVKETPMAWKPYVVPAPYQPKGE